LRALKIRGPENKNAAAFAGAFSFRSVQEPGVAPTSREESGPRTNGRAHGFDIRFGWVDFNSNFRPARRMHIPGRAADREIHRPVSDSLKGPAAGEWLGKTIPRRIMGPGRVIQAMYGIVCGP
jgi:hypothetical protein